MHTEDELLSEGEIRVEDYNERVAEGAATSSGTSYRVVETIPLWWGGVDSCNTDDRIKSELSIAFSRWLNGQIEARPDATLTENGYRVLNMRYVTKKPFGGRRKCSANGAMECYALFSLK